jgi:hypothetical protein
MLDGNLEVLSTKEAEHILTASQRNFEHPLNDVLKRLLNEGIVDARQSFKRDGWFNVQKTPLTEKLVADFGSELQALTQPKAVSHASISYRDLLGVLHEAVASSQGVTLTATQIQTLVEHLPPTKPSGQYGGFCISPRKCLFEIIY